MAEIQDELDLLLSMYPDEVTFNSRNAELTYKQPNGHLCLRLPSDYPLHAMPDVISSIGPDKIDIRDKVMELVRRQQIGESCLDVIITEFCDLLSALESKKQENDKRLDSMNEDCDLNTAERGKTVIVWLHHLLATTKRKQALAPEGSGSASVSGITKPGYPGVLMFSGPASAVNIHVQELKHLRWQAFQMRYEADEEWHFKHGNGIIEVETMGEIVSELELVIGGKEIFMEAMKMK
jgi:hypothetical protein